jgi:hypothetical protein
VTARRERKGIPPAAAEEIRLCGSRAGFLATAPVALLALLVLAAEVTGGLPPEQAEQKRDTDDYPDDDERDRIASGEFLEEAPQCPEHRILQR